MTKYREITSKRLVLKELSRYWGVIRHLLCAARRFLRHIENAALALLQFRDINLKTASVVLSYRLVFCIRNQRLTRTWPCSLFMCVNPCALCSQVALQSSRWRSPVGLRSPASRRERAGIAFQILLVARPPTVRCCLHPKTLSNA